MNQTDNNEDVLQSLYSEYLKSRKLRHTAERDAIFAKICRTKNLFTLDTIWQQLEEDNFHISRASLYNTIELLLDAKIVIRHQFTSATIQYELKHIAEQHHHTICTSCGAIGEIKNGKINNPLSVHKIPKFTSEYYTLYYYGICSKCKYKQKHQTIKKTNK
jgi:Fur family ferric uptake transcriptional regulator